MKSAQEIPGAALPLMEGFYTLQGEGFFQGHAAYFIRLGGCDVGCVWCDVKDSWNAADFPTVKVEEIVKPAVASGCRIAVVTGGEPTLYDLSSLTEQLRHLGIHTHLETSGCYPLTGSWDWICLSPKKFKASLPHAYSCAHELKVVVYHKSDLKWAEEQASKVAEKCTLFLQPEWSRTKEITPLIVDYIKQHPQWKVSLQAHKYIGIP